VKDIIKADNNIDVALVGRMVADDAELNVDAAVQVAHALSVQAVEQEFDYFTAVDDFQESKQEIGAGMIGTIEFNSSTL
jgi:CRISPR system Cascade subunit CasC